MLKVISVAYHRLYGLQILINSFILQTNPNWELHIIHDGIAPPSVSNVIESCIDPRIIFKQTEEVFGNYGHPNRKKMLAEMEGTIDDYVLMTNDDNYYVPVFVDKMLKKVSRATGIVYCDTIHSHFDYNVHHSKLKEHHIDIGAFIVRLDVAKAVGFNHIHFSADGVYAEECDRYCMRRGLQRVYLPQPLFIHN